MKAPDVDKERSERKLSLLDFLKTYNKGLPKQFPRASHSSLEEYRKEYPAQFKDNFWSLDQHRKKVMDWLTARMRVSQ